MERKTMMYGVRAGIVAGIFAAGFMCGTVSQRNAEAQMGDVGGAIMQKAAGGGGTVGTVAKLGTAITDMEKEVNGLQKNLAILKNVKSALSVGK